MGEENNSEAVAAVSLWVLIIDGNFIRGLLSARNQHCLRKVIKLAHSKCIPLIVLLPLSAPTLSNIVLKLEIKCKTECYINEP